MEDALTDEDKRSDEKDLFIGIGNDDRDSRFVPEEESPGGGEGQGSDDELVIVDGGTDRKASKAKEWMIMRQTWIQKVLKDMQS